MKTSKPVSFGQIASVVAVAVILTALIVGLSVYLNMKNKDDDSELNKDVALGVLMQKDALTGTFEDKKIIITQKELVLDLLKIKDWKYLPDYNNTFHDSLALSIDDGYTMSLGDNEVARIQYDDKVRYYSVPSDILPIVTAYLYDNTFISPADASSFLAASDNVTVTVLGSSKTVPSGAQLASALNMSEWTESDSVYPDFEPTVIVDTKTGLKINVYKSINIGVIEYSGTNTVYSVNELSVASSELVAKSYFNDVSSLFDGKISDGEGIKVTKGGEEYNLSPDTSLDILLDVTNWERRFTAPAGLPDKGDIFINGGKSVTVSLYSAYSVAEFENVYYSVPSTVFSSITELLKGDSESPETISVLKTSISNSISEKKQIPVQYKGNQYIVSVQSDLLSALGISSWTESPVLELIGEPDIVFELNKLPALSISIYPSKNSAIVISGGDNKVYRIPSAVSSALITYIQDNLYTESWTVSATELGALQKKSEGVDITVTDKYSFREKYSEDSEDAIDVLAAVDLLPSESVPDIISPEKTEILFKGSEKFLMTFYPLESGQAVVNVSGTFYSKGKYIDRWFLCSSSYSDIVKGIMEVNAKSSDTAAALFCESLRTGDIDTINRLTGNSSFDYSGIKTLMLNYLSIESSDGNGQYTVRLNVEDPVDSPFEKGIKDYVLTVSSSGGSLSVTSFIPLEEYNTVNLSSSAVAAVDSFTSWVDAAGITFESIEDFSNSSAIAAYLMMNCRKDGIGEVSSENPSLFLISDDEMNSAAKKYFAADKYVAHDIAAYNSETKMYSYEGISSPTRYKRVSSLEFNEAGDASVTYKWYADPLCLYCTDTLVYNLTKNEDGSFAILSAVKPVNGENGEETPENPALQPEVQDNNGKADEGDDSEHSGDDAAQSFAPPAGLTPTETLFKYFEYLNEKDAEKANSLVYETYAKSDEEFAFDKLTKISVKSCAEVPSDYDWYDPWYKSPAAYVCVVAEVSIEASEDQWLIYTTESSSIEIYMIKTSDDSDWRIIMEKPGGEGILDNQ
jgi:hypothetical protein